MEEVSFKLDGLDMADVVYLSYFEVFRKPGLAKCNYPGKAKGPFQLLSGGYQMVFKNG